MATMPLGLFDVSPLAAGRYLDWRASLNPLQPSGMRYYQMVRVTENGYYIASTPSGDDLEIRSCSQIRGLPGSLAMRQTLISQDNVTPEAYARQFHDAYTDIHAIDPTARFVSNGLVQVSKLRLAWLESGLEYLSHPVRNGSPCGHVEHSHLYCEGDAPGVGFQHPSWHPQCCRLLGCTMAPNGAWPMMPGRAAEQSIESRTTYANAWFGFRGN